LTLYLLKNNKFKYFVVYKNLILIKYGVKDKKMARSIKVAKVGVKKENGYLYFVDKDGDVSKVLMNRGGKKKKAVKKKPAKKPVKKKVAKKKPAKKRR
jgi:hypothetical protein